MAQDFYSILGVNKGSSDDEIKKAYRNLVKKHHPDRFKQPSEKEFNQHTMFFQMKRRKNRTMR